MVVGLPSVRSATLHGYVDLAQSLGLEPTRLMRDAGLELADLASADTWLPAANVVRLLEASAGASGREDFGLLLSERRRRSTLGPLSLVLREEPDVRSAVDLLLRYERSYNEVLRMELVETGGLATIRVWIELGEPAPAAQALDLAVAALAGVLRGFLGPEWQPRRACFTHPAPANLDTHRRLLGGLLQFDHEFTGLVFFSRELDTKNTESDPLLRPFAQQLLASLPPPRAATPVESVRELVALLLPLGRCSVGQVARSMRMDRRTLHRRLATQGETFTSVLNATRAGLAERYIANPGYSLTDISELLGFSTPSAFSRWFRAQFGTSAREWRQATRAERSSSAPVT